VGSLFNIAYDYGYVKDKKHLFTGVDNTVDNSVDKSVDNPSISLNTVNTGFVAGLFLQDGSPIVMHHSNGGTSNPSTMCNLLRPSTSPLIATIIANAEPRGSAPIVLDSSVAY
jgi:hypothetical protein